jgi:hypothetical protein
VTDQPPPDRAARPGSAPATAELPDAFLAVDRGTATTAAALVGRIAGRRRLLAAVALPAGADPDAVAALVVDRARSGDADLVAAAGVAGDAAGVPRITAFGSPARVAAVLAATEATRAVLEADAVAAGWRAVGSSAELDDVLVATARATRPDVALLVVGTADSPGGDERDLVGELVALAAGVAERRPGLPVVLVGAAAARIADLPLGSDVIVVPRARGDDGDDLRTVLAARRGGPDDARQALAAAGAAVARALGLRVELLEVGMSGALRVRATPATAADGEPAVAAAEVPAAALGLAEDDAVLDRIVAWTTLAIDRARLRDRLAELRLDPWTDADGEGALLRAAALRTSIETLVAATDAELGGPAPDLVVLAGGAWSAIPAPAALLVLADAVRRPGVVQVALDPGRLLAPLGTVADADARLGLVRDLLSDALVPLGTLVVVGGVRGGRSAGSLRLVGPAGPMDLDLAAGGLALVDLPPGQAGAAELAFRSAVDLGARGRRFAVPVTGGLAGLVVDTRDLPLRLPERGEDRRAVLATWERALWPDRDR